MGESGCRKRGLGLFLVLAVVSSWGCAYGTTRLDLKHSPLAMPTEKKEGRILVEPLRDVRPPERREYIGVKRNGFNAEVGHFALREGEDLGVALCHMLTAAVRSAGYAADCGGEALPADEHGAHLRGEIREFWADTKNSRLEPAIRVGLELVGRSGESRVWSREIQGRESRIIWMGTPSELEGIEKGALDEALGMAVGAFSSAEFQQAVRELDAADAAKGSDAAVDVPEGEVVTE